MILPSIPNHFFHHCKEVSNHRPCFSLFCFLGLLPLFTLSAQNELNDSNLFVKMHIMIVQQCIHSLN